MGWTRATISGGMVSVALTALWLAALRSGSLGWFQAIYAATLVALLAASLLARSSRGRSGSFWNGFALFGWAYLLLGAANLGAITFGYSVPTGPPSDLLPVTGWLRALLELCRARDGLWSGEPLMAGGAYDAARYNRILWIAQFLVALVVGLAGGVSSLLIHTRTSMGASRRRTRA